jgi:hypothetical protein
VNVLVAQHREGFIPPERNGAQMNTILKSLLGLHMTAMFLTVVLAGPAAAKNQVPFHGSLQGVESGEVQGTTLVVEGSGTGIATHLGRFTVTWDVTVNLLNGSGSGSFHFIAANGDSLFTEGVGQAEPTDTPGVILIVEINTIAGGTGRFEGATGSFTLKRLLDPTGFTAGSFKGSIVMPGAP